jgi:hypothetical protein
MSEEKARKDEIHNQSHYLFPDHIYIPEIVDIIAEYQVICPFQRLSQIMKEFADSVTREITKALNRIWSQALIE